MAHVRFTHSLAAAAVLAACGDPEGSNPFDSAEGTGVETGQDAGPGGGASTAADGADSTGAGAAATSGSAEGDPIKLDVAAADEGGGPVECGCGNDEWSYIWVANAQQGTVSRIDTRTLVEEGRYVTRPDGAGNPSRTSVSLGGRAVAVANRHGGVVKIWAREQFCDEGKNGQPGLQTSTGPGDVLPWEEDDCVAWYTPFPDYTTQRPIAWAGNVDPRTCDDEAVWTAGCGGGFQPGFGGAGDVFAPLLEGTDGTVLETVEVSGFFCSGFGAYGGAVDSDGNFWISHNGTGGKLGVVWADTLTTDVWDVPPGGFAGYGITVDNAKRPWVSSYGGDIGAARFDPVSETWTTVPGFASQGGIQQGEDGRIWAATVSGFGGMQDQNGVVWIDADSATVGDFVAVGGGTVKGISLDVDGFVWAVSGTANKLDADTYQVAGSYAGLTGPYTYSDMTGWGLQNSVCNPAG